MASDWSADELMTFVAQYSKRFGALVPQDVLDSAMPVSELIDKIKVALASGKPVEE